MREIVDQSSRTRGAGGVSLAGDHVDQGHRTARCSAARHIEREAKPEDRAEHAGRAAFIRSERTVQELIRGGTEHTLIPRARPDEEERRGGNHRRVQPNQVMPVLINHAGGLRYIWISHARW